MRVRRFIYYGGVSPYEPETTAFLNTIAVPNDGTIYHASTPYEITGAELWTGLDAFVVSVKNAFSLPLKANNLNTRLNYLYPRIGGTALAHKYNLVDPTAYIGTFSGGWTHDGSGALPNGTNAYMTTDFQLKDMVKDDVSFGLDSKTNTDGLYADFGVIGGGDVLLYGKSGGSLTTRLYSNPNNSTAIADSLGLLSMSRTASTGYKQFKNGSVHGTITQASDPQYPGTSTRAVVEAAVNNGGSIIQYSPRKRTLLFAGSGMTDTEMADFVTAWQTFDTLLNR
jgi:hypothetical protein